MPINFTPYPGTIVRCDFSNLQEGEMVKPRPVLVLSPREERSNKQTIIVVCLSTTAPFPVRSYHLKIELPGKLPHGMRRECWVKGDMIYSISLKRLDFYRLSRGDEGKRSYYYNKIPDSAMKEVRRAAGCAMGAYFLTS